MTKSVVKNANVNYLLKYYILKFTCIYMLYFSRQKIKHEITRFSE
jgi:hypothetical protein